LKNVLFVSYEFPPLNRGGVYRPLGFVKYLKDFGINPIILTLAQRDFPVVYGEVGLDNSIIDRFFSNMNIIEVSSLKLLNSNKSKFLNFINIFFSINGREGKAWEVDFKIKIKSAIDKYKPSALIVTAPPFSIIPLVINAGKQYNIPVITDFRDAMSQWNMNPFGSYFHYFLTLKNERKYLIESDAIIVTSKQTLNDFSSHHPKISASKFNYIPNGFDGKLEEWTPLPEKQSYTIGYVGSFYYTPETRKNLFTPWWRKKGHHIFQYSPNLEDWLYRSPYFFFKTFSYFIEANPIWKKRIKIKFAGFIPDWLIKMIEEFCLNDIVELKGVISHKDSINFQKECDVLLITSAKKINGRDYSIAGKTFEYFKTQKPILAFVAEGAQKDLLNESGMALILNPDEIEASARLMHDFFERKMHLNPNISFIEQFDRKMQTKKLAKVIQDLN